MIARPGSGGGEGEIGMGATGLGDCGRGAVGEIAMCRGAFMRVCVCPSIATGGFLGCGGGGDINRIDMG